MKLSKNTDLDKYGYSGFGIGFEARSQFSWPHGSWSKNVVIFGVDNSSGVVNAVKMYQFKAKNLEIKLYSVSLSNISKDFTMNNIKRTGLKGNVYAFSVDYNIIDTNNILDI